MPTYNYKCPDCSQSIEAVQKMGDDSLTKCPYCSENNLKKIFYSPGLTFKGSGFYSSDNKKV